MSATISDASHRASGATDLRLMVQLPLRGPGHADDVEFDVAAKRVPVERISHPPLDLREGRRGFGKIPIEIHFAPPICVGPAVAADHLWGYCWGRFG